VSSTLYCYLDASALAKRYAPETGTAAINHLFTRLTPDRLVVFNVGVAEVVSILVRKRNAKRLSPAACSQATIDFGVEIVNQASLRKVAADTSLVTASLPLINKHAINATDSILLRSALDLAAYWRASSHDLVLVASDQRLLRAAQAEGLVVFNPETQTEADLDSLLR